MHLSRTIQIGLGLTLLAYLPTLVGFVGSWWTGYNYSQGLVLAPAVAWIVWRARHRLMARLDPAPLVALAVLAMAALWFAAVVMDVRLVEELSFTAIMLGWGVAVLGFGSLVWLLPAAATFSLGIQIWDLVTVPLQLITVVMSGAMVDLLGIEAVIEGQSISIQYGTFVVERGCAGVAFFLAGVTVGALYSHLFMRGWRTRLGVVVFSALLAMAGNWVRVAFLVWLGESTQMQSPLIYEHGAVGWYIFTLSLLPFFLVARWMERWNAPVPDPVVPADPPAPVARATSRAVVLATAAALAGPGLYLGIGLIPTRTVGEEAITPATDGWTQAPERSRSEVGWTIEYVGSDRTLSRAWERDGEVVFAEQLVYEDQSQGAELIGWPNRIAADSLVLEDRSVGPIDTRGRTVREAWVRGPDGVDLVWYWYRIGEARTASGSRAKILQFLNFLRRREGAELLTVTTPCDEDGCGAAARRLFEFVTGVTPEIS
jgi:EpsI family protein